MGNLPDSKRGDTLDQPVPSALVSEMAPVGSLAVAAEFDAHPDWNRLPLRSYPWIDDPPAHVVDAAATAARHPEPVPTLGLEALRTALARELSGSAGTEVGLEEIAVTNGAMGALDVLWAALLEPGDEVVVPAPNYYVEGAIKLAGGQFRPVAAVTGHRTNWDRITSALGPRTKVLFLTNPNNPIGKVLTHDDLGQLEALAESHPSLWFVVDESYEAIQHDRRQHIPAWVIPALRNRSAIVRSFSKSFAVTWLRVGWIAAPSELIRNVAKVIQWQQLYGSCLNQRVALAVLEGERSWLRRGLVGFSEGRDLLYEQIVGIAGCSVELPEAGPFLFPDVSGNGRDVSALILELHKRGVVVIPGGYFAGSSASFRIPVGGTHQTQARAAEILVEVLSS